MVKDAWSIIYKLNQISNLQHRTVIIDLILVFSLALHSINYTFPISYSLWQANIIHLRNSVLVFVAVYLYQINSSCAIVQLKIAFGFNLVTAIFKNWRKYALSWRILCMLSVYVHCALIVNILLASPSEIPDYRLIAITLCS